jgi:autotransporter-associated beta strand protein
MLPRSALLVPALAAGIASTLPVFALPAFPGAEGFGAEAVGGRGGSVYIVTNLNDSGPGSFRDAVSQPNRTVVFAVGGIIRINSRVVVRPNITIAGQTAPGEGITIYGNGVSFTDANNTITRYIRFRQGIFGDSGSDAVSIASGDRMIFDHVSASWGRDETFSVSGTPSNITLQDCIVGQGLLVHSAGGLMQTSGGVSVFRCLYTDNWMRNPKVKGVHEFTNNVVYNWGSGGGYIMGGDSAGQTYANIINNYFIDGPNTVGGAFKTGNLNFHAYAVNNYQDSNRNGALDGQVVSPLDFTTADLVSTPYPYPAVLRLLTPQEAYQHVVTNAGASLRRDRVDTFMVSELTSLGTVGAQITNESQVGGPGPVQGGVAPKDTDKDGMPDWWESAAGHDPLVADNNGDANGDGYTNLENYINSLAPAGIVAAQITGIQNDTGTSASDGVTADTTLVIQGTALPGSTVVVARADIGQIGSTTADASGQWSFDYTSTVLPDRHYAFTATATHGGITYPPSKAMHVQVDTTAAVVPTITSVVSSPSFAINGSADPGDVVTVTLVGSGVIGSATTDELGNWTVPYTGAALPPGLYSFTAAGVDQAGNPGAASAQYAVDTSITPPVLATIANDTGVSNSDKITNDPTLMLSGTAPASASVAITRVGVGVIGSTTATAGGTWSFDYTTTTLPAGVHAFYATATVGGTSSAASAAVSVTIDTTAPAVASIRRKDPTTPATLSSNLTYRVLFTEAVSGVDLADFAVTVSGAAATLAGVTPVDATTYDVSLSGASGDGTVRLDLRNSGTGIIDLAGNNISGGFTAGQTYTIRLPGTGVWSVAEDGNWSDASRWENGSIAEGSGATADFGTLDVDDLVTVKLDSARTVGRLVFGDADSSTPGQWKLTDAGNNANTLTLAMPSGTPGIVVTATGTGSDADIASAASANPATLDVSLVGTMGFAKSGLGTALLVRPVAVTGNIAVNNGYLKLGPGSSLSPSGLSIGVSAQLHVAGGDLTATAPVNITSGGNSGIVVSAGTANLNAIVPTNARNSLIKVTGGTLNATSLMFQRSADAANMWGVGLVVQGGNANLGTLGLGTGNSWGATSVEGGTLSITGPIWVGWQATSGRGGQLRVTGGTFVSTDSTDGIVMSRKNGTNANNVAQAFFLGGTSTVEKFTLGYDATVNAGSATINVDGGALYLGAGGIVKNGTGGFVTTVNLSKGVLGAHKDWSTSVPLTLPAANTVELRAGDAAGAARNITLAGGLTGPGGFTKTGLGRLVLSSSNSFTGPVMVAGGSLVVDGSIDPAASVNVTAGGVLAGVGSASGQVTLDADGIISPADQAQGALTVGSLVWNGGGRLRFDVGTPGDRLNVNGALSKGTTGAYTVEFHSPSPVSTGTVLTIATFGSTTFAATDFSPAGLYGTFAINGTTLNFTVQDPPGTAFRQWLSQFAVPVNAQGTQDDPDADGLSNLLEFALALAPDQAGADGVVTTHVTVGNEAYPAISFVRRTNIGDAQLQVKVATELSFQQDLGSAVVSTTPRNDGTEEVVIRSAAPLSQHSRQYFRIFVTIPNL